MTLLGFDPSLAPVYLWRHMANLGKLTAQVNSFESMADLPGFAEKQKALLRKCDAAYAIAQIGRSYTDKAGEHHSQPDSSAMIKCIELAARLLGILTEAEKRAREGEGDTVRADIEYIAGLLRSAGYDVKKAA